MASYVRSLFGGNNNSSARSRSSSSSKGHSESSRSKSHSRSRSTTSSNPKPTIVYVHSHATSTSSALMPSPSRTPRPSPLRYNTYDSTSISSKTRPMRPLELRSGSIDYQSGDTFVPYPIYTPDLSSNSRTTSNSSVYSPSSVSGHGHNYSSSQQGHRPPMGPRTSSSGSVPRPALKQTNTWHAGESTSRSQAHVSFVNPKRRITLHMHPLLATSQFSRAPICYDVSRPPSPQTIVDRNTRSAIPAVTLNQPATDPSTMSRLVLRSNKFPWHIIVDAGCSSQKKTVPKFYLGGSSPTGLHHPSSLSVSCADVLHAVHTTLSHPATPEEWDALGRGSHAQRKISRAYDRRCRSLGSGWDGGIRRVDWLGEKFRLIGVEVDKDSDSRVGNLVFGRS
ncbi:hypothetical protein DFJ43DRAFT_1130335 [Lentinula guzmanii]|uniref:DUF6699 domain-containing protein n=1 Tax=Lentinula guzmanii TaxID=2804957 RepID=A0AA38JY34_9AGAR|nr:hypothetical protein DFJ43DRAFT_1130335 [Lentinula guzmanii]